ncbi:MAG: two-component regulator propeller domain-containing protein [Vicinamibacterales bacterium]
MCRGFTRFVSVLFVSALLTSPPGATALEIDGVLSGFTLASWRDHDGTRLGRVSAIAQDADGYLWLGTGIGLLRFDGLHFDVPDRFSATRLPAREARAVLATSDGSVWVGFARGGGAHRLVNGAVDAAASLAVEGTVHTVAEDATGRIWAGHDGGLSYFAGGQWHVLGRRDGLPAVRVLTVVALPDGSLRVGTTAGVYALAGDHPRARAVSTPDVPVRDLVQDGPLLLVTHPEQGFAPLGADTTARQMSRPSGRGAVLMRDRRGHLWVGTLGQGLWRVADPRGADTAVERATVLTGLLSDGVFSVFEDSEGNVWAGTTEGLTRLTPHTATPITGLGVVSSLALAPDGSAWAGSTDGLFRIGSTTTGGTDVREVLRLDRVSTVQMDRHGALWLADHDGLARVVGGRIVRVSAQGLPARVRSIAFDRGGRAWLTGADGTVAMWDARTSHATAVPIPSPASFAIVDAAGALWAALRSGEVARVGPSGTRVYGPAHGLPHSVVHSLVQDHHGRLWVAGDRGLSRFDAEAGRFQTVDEGQGLLHRRVVALVEDDQGRLWLGLSEYGLIRMAPEEFDQAVRDRTYQVRYEHHDTTGGVAGVPIALNSRNAARGPDGRLWFVTGRGLTVVDPRAERAAAPPTRPRVAALFADERELEPARALTLPADVAMLRIDYTTLNLTFPERMRFRYRLDGFSDDWVDAGTRRQAIFTNLKPGDYRFRLQARTNDGDWRDADASLGLLVDSHLYQTLPFRIGVVGLAGLVAWAVWSSRVRTVRRELGLVFSERMRLARDLHDTLLQSLVGVSLQLHAVATGPGLGADERTHLTAIRRSVDGYIREVRASIRDLRSPAQVAEDLPHALERTCHHAVAGAGARVEVVVAGDTDTLGARVRTHLLRISHEAVSNAVRHGGASHVAVRLAVADDVVHLQVSDDGCGFDPDVVGAADAGHFGISGMRERAEDLGGRLTLATRPGAGTLVNAVVPVRVPA